MLNRASRMLHSGETATTAPASTAPATTAPAPAAPAPTAPAAQALPEGVKGFNQTQAGQDRMLPRFKLSDLEGENIIIHSVEDFLGKFGPGLRAVITKVATGERGVLLGHWSVIGKYLESMQAAGDLPVYCQVIKAEGKRYFDFTDPSRPALALDEGEAAIPF